ncbi:MAG: hypothetical protein UW47_C0005G0041 [Candidatus Woesebacteria bacterium GW2011_GWA1_44_23]|uniref:Core-binding (CB) domain-containing protein n=1 Tax=Candidatus Woesebacteria bacterium GW2011_GWA1_44_23 TaxID=1618558 RepID=A0A837IFC9_9BACT|nr:MAG: hypothetical protein UW47_C0005G0041 [Candidatus Woesebacteria bacterium GW2011_GWA1_44_23]
MSNLPDITPDLIKRYQEDLVARFSPATVKRKSISVGKFLDWAQKEGFLDTNPGGVLSAQRSKETLIPAKAAGKTGLRKWYHRYQSIPGASYLGVAVALILASTIGLGVYNQFFKNAQNPLAYPTSLTPPSRYLSFQGRLTNQFGNPITAVTSVTFKLYDDPSAGTTLWTGTCNVSPDTDGVFSSLLGSDCGTQLTSNVFSENAAVWLGVKVESDLEATPRVQIATVAYATNSETLQGFPASASATINTVPVIDNSGQLVIAASSPKIQSTSGTFAIEGQALTISTPTASNGDVTIAPDGTGQLNLTFSGASPGSGTGMVNATDANLTSGSLYYGEVANDATGYNLLELASGATPRTKFAVDSAGNATLSGTINGLAISGGTITSGTWNGTVISTTYGGTGQDWDSIAQGSLPYFSGTGTMSTLAPGTSGYVLMTQGASANPIWTPSSGVGTNYWQLTSNALSPVNSTYALNIGNTASTSAYFHVPGTNNQNAWFNLGTGYLGVGTTSPTAILDISGNTTTSLVKITQNHSWSGTEYALTVSGYSNLGGFRINAADGANAIYNTLNGTLGFTNNQGYPITFSSWSGSTGTERMRIDTTSGNVGIGTTSPSQKLDVAGNVNISGYATASASLNVGSGNALAGIGNISYSNALLPGGVAGTSGYVLTSSGGGVNTWTNPATVGTNYWQLNGLVLSPANAVAYDLTIGGTATGSAFQVFAATGNITTSGDLALNGGDITSTGDLTIDPAGGDVFLNSDNLNLTASTNLIFGSTSLGEYTSNTDSGAYVVGVYDEFTYSTATNVQGVLKSFDTAIAGASLWQRTAGSLAPANITDSLNLGNTATASALVHLAGTTGENSWINTGSVGIGTTNPTFKLHVIGTAGFSNTVTLTTNNGFFFGTKTDGSTTHRLIGLNNSNQLQIGENANGVPLIFKSGSSGQMLFDTSGNLGIGLTNPSYKLDVTGDINLTGALRDNGSAGTSGQVLSTTGTGVQWIDAAGVGTNYWSVLSNNTIYPTNTLQDLLLGSSATASAKFAFKGVGSGVPTASISGTTANVATFIDGNGNISTTNRNNLILGNSSTYNSTGNILLNPNGTGNVGIGTTAPSGKTHILGSTNSGNQLLVLQSSDDSINDNALEIQTSSGTVVSRFRGDGRLFVSNQIGVTNGAYSGNWYGHQLDLTGSGTVSITAAGNSYFNSGNVGLGTVSPTAKLDVAGDASTSASLVFRGATPTIDILNGSTLTFQSSPGGDAGLTSIATLAPAGNFTVNGTLNGLTVSGGTITGGTWNGSLIGTQWGGTGANNSTAAQYSVPYYSATGVLGGVLAPGTSGYVLTTNSTSGAPTWTNAGSVGTNYWQLNSLVLSPANASAYDLAIGGTATGSAFQVFAATGDITTSGDLALNGGDLTTTGDLTINPAGGDVYLNSDNLNLTASTNLIFGSTSLGEYTSNTDSGAYVVGVYDEFTYSTATNIQGVLKSFDTAIAGASLWQRTTGSLAPANITDSLNLGATATASALVHLAGTSGENSFINTGNVGIGTSAPSTYKLQVVGTGGFSTDRLLPLLSETLHTRRI